MRVLTTLLLGLIGLFLLGGGVWLIALGGSGFYAALGLGLVACAYLVWRRNRHARLLYALLVAATLGWALWEVGLDWWPLGTRGGLVILLGLWLLTPWAVGGLRRWDAGRVALAAVILVSLGVAGASLLRDEQRLEGRLADSGSGTAGTLDPTPAGEWQHYGRTLAGQRYTPLTQITPENVGNLEVAWTYRTGDVRGPDDVTETTYQVTPLKVGELLYLCTPHNIAIALDAATGQERWRFDPKGGLDRNRQHQTCRGVSYFRDTANPGAACAARVFLPTSDARLIALDAASGEVCPGFGEGGTVNLWANMPNQRSGFYYSTSPPAVVNGLVIIGGAVNDNYANESPSGVIRAYDARSGALVWNWDSGNPDRTTPLAAGETYTPNSPNSWSVFSADPALGLVYIPLGNRTPDQLGMDRSPAVERFSSSIVALDVATGQVRWVRQTVHHDLWDMDVPAQPVLIDLTTAAGPVPALVGPTKQGDIFVLDRRTGEPIVPLHEVPAPGGAIAGDTTSPTQPVSELSFNPPPLREADMWGASLLDQLACRIKFRSLRYEGRYTPPSLEGTLVYPGNFGVFNWGSVAVDPVRQVMFGMPTYLAFTSQLVPSEDISADEQANSSEAGLNVNEGGAYGVRMGPFVSPLGLPCQAPPWGYVAGVDLKTGAKAWMHRNGTIRDAASVALPPLKLGVPGIGGPILTATGVAFLAATIDDYIRAYDVHTGAQIWQQRLPAGGQATPMSYEAGGRQFVVQVAGGHGSLGTRAGDYVIAYALPAQR
ncbi:glucose/quinate/shikimate family membrane-bound PQQ-dependent dehydrogenase [Ancylobacter lacus]|uniref:glucose/quinate/shikimate family membrane-bound PQQ-dependent dehydrogenase n=1 Tax=Ancylobacter lacus TaxID=2579970 RepID=UPI001BCB0C4E|nr:glucose/quinate/shikimate family membrane-bound PQQ-dependent dehydrogenase [Ancylobacter lacus]MBS7538110.1 glucose/quinate/shikimate family membrane-bound PQQ-dependent dehydrogenase [Ancylobacter lacus]